LEAPLAQVEMRHRQLLIDKQIETCSKDPLVLEAMNWRNIQAKNSSTKMERKPRHWQHWQ